VPSASRLTMACTMRTPQRPSARSTRSTSASRWTSGGHASADPPAGGGRFVSRRRSFARQPPLHSKRPKKSWSLFEFVAYVQLLDAAVSK